MKRTIGKYLLGIVAISGAIIGGLLLIGTSEAGSKFIWAKLRAEVLADTQLDITFHKLDVDILPPKIRITETKVLDRLNRIACEIEEIEFSPAPLNLLSGILTIEEVYLGSPTCDVSLNTEDINTLIENFKKDDGEDKSAEFDFSKIPSFEVFAVSTARLEVKIDDEERLGALSLAIDGFGVDVTGGKESIEIRGLLGEGSVQWEKGEDRVFERLVDMSFRAALSEKSFDVRQLTTKVAGADIRVRDARIPIPVWPEGVDIADLSATVPLESFERLPLDFPTMFGTAGFLGQIALRKNEEDKIGLSARGQVTLDSAVVDDFVIGDLNGIISLNPQGVSFAETEIRTAEGLLRASGNIAFDDQLTTELSLYLREIELAHLLEQLTVSDSYVFQKMTGPIKLKGRLKPFRMDGTLEIQVDDHTVTLGSFRSRNPDVALHVPKVSVQGRVNVTENDLTGTNLRIMTGASAVDANIHVDFATTNWTLNAKSKKFQLSDVKKIAGFEVSGSGPLECKFSGRMSEPDIQGKADFDQLAFSGIKLGKTKTKINYRDGLLTFNNLVATRKQGQVSTSELLLDFNSKDNLHITTKIDVQSVEIQDVGELFEIDTKPYGSPTGLATGRVSIDYALTPDRLRVDVDVTHNHVTIFEERFGKDVLRLNWDDGQLTVSEFGLKKGRGTVSVTGTVRPDKTMNFMVLASGIKSTAIDNPTIQNLGIETTGQIFAVVEGTLDRPKGNGEIRLGESVYKKVRYGPSMFYLTLNGSKLSGHGRLAGTGVILENLALNFDNDHFTAKGTVYSLDILPITNLQFEDHRASLTITGEFEFSGKLKQNSPIQGHASLKQVQMVFDDLSFTNKDPLHIRSERNQFRIEKTRFEGNEIVFDLTGTFGGDALDIKSRGQIDLRSTSELFSWMSKSEGRLDFEFRVRGSYGNPSLRGQATLENGMIKLTEFPYQIENIQGKVLLSPKVVRFLDFRAKAAGGNLRASGDMHLEEGGIADYRFRLQTNNLELALMDNLVFKASTTKDGLILRSPDGGKLPTLVGDVEIKRLKYTQDIRVFELSDLSVDRLSGSRSRASRPKIFDARNDFFKFDIHLHGDRNIEARNNVFDADLAIDDLEKPLRVVGTNQTFGFLGRVKGKKGEVRFAGKRFNIKYATIEFQDPSRPSNPNFRVTADGQIRDWRVTMTAEGSVDEYELKFSSQPYLSKEDIVFVILTGFTRAEQRQFGGSGLSIGAPLIGQFGPTSDALPLEFRVYNDYSERSGTETTRVALGRWITPDVWVSVSSGVGDDRDVEADVDYKINDELSVSAGYENDNEGSVGNLGLDLKFRLEF